MALVIKPNTFTVGYVADAAAVNANFDTIFNDYNGNITDANIANTGITTYGKVSGSALSTLGNTNSGAGLLPNANIAPLTVAGKVDGAALTGLANTPVGAGALPAANVTVTGLGTHSNPAWNTAVQAATDGFVTAEDYTASTANIVVYEGVDAGSLVAKFTQPLSAGGHTSVTIPIKKGKWWKVTGNTQSTPLLWVPWGN